MLFHKKTITMDYRHRDVGYLGVVGPLNNLMSNRWSTIPPSILHLPIKPTVDVKSGTCH